MILLQESDSPFDDVTQIASKQFHVYHGADQLIFLSPKNNFELGGVMAKTVISGKSNQNSDLGKAEALEKHVKAVTMRAGSSPRRATSSSGTKKPRTA